MVNRFLRTAPTSRVLGALVGLAVAIAAGTTIALEASGAGPVPPHKPLAVAIRQALGAPAAVGISGRVTVVNNLISSSQIQGSDPLLNGGSGRFWLTQGALRLEIQGDNGDANLVVRNGSFWAYDPASNTVYRGTLPSGASARHDSAGHAAPPTLAQIRRQLAGLAQHLRLSGAIPTDIAGRPTYTVRVSPRQSGGLLGAAELAWDAARGVPLRLALYARRDSTPVLSIEATQISYGRVAGSVFRISPPRGAHVVHIAIPSRQAAGGGSSAGRTQAKPATGVSAVARRLTFALRAPVSAGGLPRTAVRLLGRDRALVLYGHGLGTVAVIEQVARPDAGRLPSLGPSAGGDQPGLTLPTVSVGGTRAQELDTAIGTLISFQRAGVQYTVVGSVGPRVARAAAGAL